MIKPFHLQMILVSSLLISCASTPANANAQTGGPDFVVTTKNTEDRVDIQNENGVVVVDVRSPAGIGAAMFELTSGDMPEKMMFRLHLKGLEAFHLSSAQQSVSISVSSGDEPVISQAVISPDAETTILPGDPLWMEIEIVSGQGEQNIPLEQGYFEVAVPQEFLQKAGTSFQAEWIDFYR